MREEVCDIWDKHDAGKWICICTNGSVKLNGEAVMGRGVAYQAKIRHRKLPALLGSAIKHHGNKLRVIANHMLAFPTKEKWYEDAQLYLIELSARQLMRWLEDTPYVNEVYLPRPGCGNGDLVWSEVKPVIAPILDDRVVVVHQGAQEFSRYDFFPNPSYSSPAMVQVGA